MRRCTMVRLSRVMLLGATICAGFAAVARADVDDGMMESPIQTPVPTGQFISPTAATGAVFSKLNPDLPNHPDFRANGAIKTAVNGNQSELLVMTSGYNNLSYIDGANKGKFEAAASNEYIFVYDISGANAQQPSLVQTIKIPDTFLGLTYAPDGLKFYASGGVDDLIHVYAKTPGGAGRWNEGAGIPLGHAAPAGNLFLSGGNGFRQPPSVAGIALSPSGDTLVAANIYNDSISVIDTATRTVKFEYDLRPFNTTPATGDGVAGGESPFDVAVKGENTVYVSSVRDREVVVVDISGGEPKLVTRIPLPGSPNSMVFNNSITQDELFVAQDNADRVAVIRTKNNTIRAEIDTIAPPGLLAKQERYTGADPNNLAVSPDGTMLYVTNGGANSLAVIAIQGPQQYKVLGLVPTGWFPNAVSVGANGAELYVVNAKSAPGPNPAHLTSSTARLLQMPYPQGNAAAAVDANASNQYIFELEQAGLLALPTPKGTDLANLTQQVASNNRYNISPDAHDETTMASLRSKIHHVIYIVKENRTFDQVLGDLKNGANGDPALAIFGRKVTPNFHRLSRQFVTLDNFFDSGEVSGNGWSWSTTARETDMVTKMIPLNYANSPVNPNGRGAPYEAEGQNRNVDVGIATTADRTAALPVYAQVAGALPGGANNLLPGTNNEGSPDGPQGTPRQSGYLWDSATRAGLTVRNYGFLLDLTRYNGPTPALQVPLLEDPFSANTIVAYPTNPTLRDVTDLYFRGYDNNFPDVFRFVEWQREFDQYVADGNLPNLTLLRLMHDHTGAYATAIDGFNTPETQQADNDYAVGLVAQTLARSPYAADTLIFVIEDDAQDGPDHVDAHRSTAYVVGPYVKQHAVVKTRYTTVNMLRTIEDVLGIDHLNLNDAYLGPMTDVFDLGQATWTYQAKPSPYLNTTSAARLRPSDFAGLDTLFPAQSAAYWAKQTEGFDWTAEDRVPADLYNQILWEGVTNGTPYPAVRNGIDLSNPSEKQMEE